MMMIRTRGGVGGGSSNGNGTSANKATTTTARNNRQEQQNNGQRKNRGGGLSSSSSSSMIGIIKRRLLLFLQKHGILQIQQYHTGNGNDTNGTNGTSSSKDTRRTKYYYSPRSIIFLLLILLMSFFIVWIISINFLIDSNSSSDYLYYYQRHHQAEYWELLMPSSTSSSSSSTMLLLSKKNFTIVMSSSSRSSAASSSTTNSKIRHRHNKNIFVAIPKPLNEKYKERMTLPSYGGLDLRFHYETKERKRKIIKYYNDNNDFESQQEEKESHNAKTYYYAFDDDMYRSPYNDYDDDSLLKIADQQKCRRTSFHRDLLIDCNKLHEFDLLSRFKMTHNHNHNNQNSNNNDYKYATYLGGGAFRDVFVFYDNPINDGEQQQEQRKIVVKWYGHDGQFHQEDYEEMRKDALVLEKFSSSNRITDIYGFCGTGMINEYMGYGNILELANNRTIRKQYDKDYADMYQGRIQKDNKIDNNNGGVVGLGQQPLITFNNLTGTQKLNLALDMAEAIALLHSYSGGVIVHDDIKADQFLLTGADMDDPNSDVRVKLNDFNRMEVMLFDTVNQEYCRYRNEVGPGKWRSPEEKLDKPLNEQIDVWSLGSSLFALMTGHKPFYLYAKKLERGLIEKEKREKERAKIGKGKGKKNSEGRDDITTTDDYNIDTETIKERVKNKIDKIISTGRTDYIDPRFSERSYGEKKICELIELCWEYNPDKRITIFDAVQFLRKATTQNFELIKSKSNNNNSNNNVVRGEPKAAAS